MTAYEDEIHARALTVESKHSDRLFALRCDPRKHASRGLALLPAGYERRIHHYSVLSRYLTRIGYSTIRFDYSNHIGLSEGVIHDFTLSSMTADIAAMARLCADLGEEKTWLVPSSLGARTAIRALSSDPLLQDGFAGVILVMPVIDAEATLVRADGWNPFEDWRSGNVTDPAISRRFLNHDLRYEFCRDALENGFAGSSETTGELSQISCSVCAIAAAEDDWVDLDEVTEAMSGTASGPRSLIVLEGSSHDLAHNPQLRRQLLTEIRQAMTGGAADGDENLELSFEEILETVQCERRWKNEDYRQLTEATNSDRTGLPTR